MPIFVKAALLILGLIALASIWREDFRKIPPDLLEYETDARWERDIKRGINSFREDERQSRPHKGVSIVWILVMVVLIAFVLWS